MFINRAGKGESELPEKRVSDRLNRAAKEAILESGELNTDYPGLETKELDILEKSISGREKIHKASFPETLINLLRREYKAQKRS